MSKLTQKFPILKKEITLKIWQWITIFFVGYIGGQALVDCIKWLAK